VPSLIFGSTPLNNGQHPLSSFSSEVDTRQFNNTQMFIGNRWPPFYDILENVWKVPDPLLHVSNKSAPRGIAGTALYHRPSQSQGHDDGAARRYQTDVRALVLKVVALEITIRTQRKKSEDPAGCGNTRRSKEALRQQLEECSGA